MTPIVDSTGLALGLMTFMLFVAVYVWTAVGLSALFGRSGEESWQGWVPFLNLAVLLRLGGLSGWLVLLVLIPVLGWIALWALLIVACHRIGADYGQGAGMTVLAALLLPLWATILGFGAARWIGAPPPPGPRRGLSPAASEGRTAPVGDDPAAGAVPRATPPAYGPSMPIPTVPGGGWGPTAAAPEAADAAPPAPGTHEPSWSEPVEEPNRLAAGAGTPPAFRPAPPLPAAGAAQRDAPPVADARQPVAAGPDGDSPTVAGEPAWDSELVAGLPRWDAEQAPDQPEWDAPPVAEAPEWDSDPAAEAAPPHALVQPPRSGTVPRSGTAPSRTHAHADAAEPAPGQPAPRAPGDGRGWAGFDLGPLIDLTEDVTAAAAAPAPIAAVPKRLAADPPPPMTRMPADDEPWAPARSPLPDPDGVGEASGQVSAVAGVPHLGTPRPATGAVSAHHTRAEAPDESMEHTILTRRRRTAWSLIPPTGSPVPITAEVVILGRKPVADEAYPTAQLIRIDDGTVSKTHARLELRADRWYVTDLGSTNGVLFATMMGTEVEATPGVAIEAGDRFYLGDAEVRLQRNDR